MVTINATSNIIKIIAKIIKADKDTTIKKAVVGKQGISLSIKPQLIVIDTLNNLAINAAIK